MRDYLIVKVLSEAAFKYKNNGAEGSTYLPCCVLNNTMLLTHCQRRDSLRNLELWDKFIIYKREQLIITRIKLLAFAVWVMYIRTLFILGTVTLIAAALCVCRRMGVQQWVNGVSGWTHIFVTYFQCLWQQHVHTTWVTWTSQCQPHLKMNFS